MQTQDYFDTMSNVAMLELIYPLGERHVVILTLLDVRFHSHLCWGDCTDIL